jgi:hypothetical protein
MVERLVSAGWLRHEAEQEIKEMLQGAEEEDGYDGPTS